MSEYVSEKSCCSICVIQKRCSVCDDVTLFACSDCGIDLTAVVYVCCKSKCRDEHERKCGHSIVATIAQALGLPAGAGVEAIVERIQRLGKLATDLHDAFHAVPFSGEGPCNCLLSREYRALRPAPSTVEQPACPACGAQNPSDSGFRNRPCGHPYHAEARPDWWNTFGKQATVEQPKEKA